MSSNEIDTQQIPSQPRSDGDELAEAAACHRSEQGFTARQGRVVDDRDGAHQRCVRRFEPDVALEHLAKPKHAALAPDALDLDRLVNCRHGRQEARTP